MSVVIYHHPRCSKSRQTLQLLQDQGIELEVIEYLKTPPSKTRLKQILTMLDLTPRQLMRRKEPEYTALGLDDESLSRDQLIAAMVETPKLIERPIVVKGDRAAVGRPPEAVLAIL
ncbi:arsenate reductase [Candidatus Tenderia electrophaga]|jgi:arsenate reductase|uniref:Arsenate reductase n=1 Tax=Candidatus Tenderia electrophaga TaxID=1748243 RepID=A0A0S2TA34_9GAMM|nr:arsenate reductase [Candidatus Tenderia electrophaga]